MLIQAARDGLSAPVNVTWEITLNCNLRCKHCLSDAGAPGRGELSTSQCFAVIDELARLKVFQINFGGGEPFIRPDFVRILDYAQSRGVVTCVSSNGALLSGDILDLLAGMEGLYLQVSLDGADEATNDSIRGKGSYRKALSALEGLSQRKIPFSVNTVLTKRSFTQLNELKKLARGYGAMLRVSRFRPSGRGKQSWDELAPDKNQLERFAEWLSGDSEILTGDSFFSLTSEHRRRMGLDMCGAAKMTCCLGPNGDLYPCAFLQEEEFRAGNILESSLKDLWLQSPIFQSFRRLEARSCEFCFRFDTCRGGCPAVAYHKRNDITAPDPECLMNCLGSGAIH